MDVTTVTLPAGWQAIFSKAHFYLWPLLFGVLEMQVMVVAEDTQMLYIVSQ